MWIVKYSFSLRLDNDFCYSIQSAMMISVEAMNTNIVANCSIPAGPNSQNG